MRPQSDAVADMRSAARWTIAAAAGVGALLLGGAPLTAAGKISHTGNAIMAYARLVVALGSVAWAIWRTGEALMPRITTLADLDDADLADLRAAMECDPSAFYDPFGAGREELRAAVAFHGPVAADLAVAAAAETDPHAPARWPRGSPTHAPTPARPACWSSRTRGRSAARRHTLVAAVVALGAVLFVGATREPAPAEPVSPVAERVS
ncbi:hypothetical protein [Actinomadura sp. DC4]|uniref:hypothetical protein n=1 Tax=Actinomadura sp. DC4 TaxID=3055069 RepID=UPI0025AFEDAA|nr:hypothetical protein [Actinomadura sp. DC4]MDN3356642.1 hypothetical protein [Actinomadura sp. DC4]